MVYSYGLESRKAIYFTYLYRAKRINDDKSFRNIIESSMKNILEKLKQLVLSLEREHGPILIFALFLREDPLEKWDVVVTASWLNASDMNSYKLISSNLQKILTNEELMELARIVVLDQNDSVVSFFQENFSVTNGSYEEIAGDLFSARFGFSIKRSYLLRCQK